ncbi:MAG TPA: class I SAM-dependent methyltransferase [Candidatus Sulfotelmatobacter sp.]|nr:class I SAM-dependent methyltransferase [Candidatus Sulfotelmatobacter sp.]
MPVREAFDCLWCGQHWSVRSRDDLEAWAHLCPECLGRAGDNPFLRTRLRQALAERAAAASGAAARAPAMTAGSTTTAVAHGAAGPTDAEVAAYYDARAPEYDDFYLRRGAYRRGVIDDMAWQMELDQATAWLDDLPLSGRIVELAAGTGWWSPLLAAKGELWCYDAAAAPLELARQRLVAHRLLAHLHQRDAWAPPEPPPAGGLFTGFWLSHVPRHRLAAFLRLAHAWLAPSATYGFIDSRRDPASGAVGNAWDPSTEVATRRLADGRVFRVPKVYYEPPELERALEAAGFSGASVSTTGRFFLLGRATT